MRSRIATNGAYIAASNVLQYVLTFITSVAVGRVLGAESLGVYGLVAAIGQIAARIAELGMPVILTRMIARAETRAARLLATALLFRVWSGVVMIGAMELFALAMGYDTELQLMLALYATGMLLSGIRELASCPYNGRERMARPAFANATFRVASFVLTIGFLAAGLDVVWATGALLGGHLAALVVIIRGDQPTPRLPPRLDWRDVRSILSESYPVAIAGILAMINLRVDAMILADYVDGASLGIYNGAFAIVIGLSLVPNSILPALYPALARTFHTDRRGAARLFWRVQLTNLVLGLAAAATVAALASYVMHTLYGSDFDGGGPTLAILAWAVPCIYLAYTNVTLLNATDRQRHTIWITAVAATTNIVGNLILVPTYGAEGAAWATVLSEAMLLVASSAIALRVITGTPRPPDEAPR